MVFTRCCVAAPRGIPSEIKITFLICAVAGSPEVWSSKALTKFAMFVVECAVPVSCILSDEDVEVAGFGITLIDDGSQV